MALPDIVGQAVAALLVAAPGAAVVLFGSHARGDAHEKSDIDLLVIEPWVENRMQEMTRLAAVLAPFKVPIDVLVASRDLYDYWKDTPNTVYYRAAREGKFYESVA